MKEKLKRLAVWYLAKYYPPTLNRIKVESKSYSFGWDGFLPDDNDWHNVAATVSAWLKCEKEDVLFDEVYLYDNGERIAEYHFDVPTPDLKALVI